MSRSEPTDTAVDTRAASRHPDLVLAGAMLPGAVTPHAADLIPDVLLEHRDRSTAAKRRGMSRHELAAQLNTASRHLADYLLGGPASSRTINTRRTAKIPVACAPARLTCAITAITADKSKGVWGGMDQVDREALRHADAQIAA